MSTESPASSSGMFDWVPRPHPHVQEHDKSRPVKVADQVPQTLNGRIALTLTNAVGTMWCAYLFAAIAFVSLPAAIQSGNVQTIVSWIAQTFLQLVLLSVIMVGQNILSAASDKRAEDTWKDADATFHTAHNIQDHLTLQDQHLAAQDARLEEIVKALAQAYPNAGLSQT